MESLASGGGTKVRTKGKEVRLRARRPPVCWRWRLFESQHEYLSLMESHPDESLSSLKREGARYRQCWVEWRGWHSKAWHAPMTSECQIKEELTKLIGKSVVQEASVSVTKAYHDDHTLAGGRNTWSSVRVESLGCYRSCCLAGATHCRRVGTVLCITTTTWGSPVGEACPRVWTEGKWSCHWDVAAKGLTNITIPVCVRLPR